MNENIDLTKILKNCPKGTEFWAKSHGAVYFQKINLSEDFPIIAESLYGTVSFSSTGQYFGEGECILIPSKDQRDWSKFTASWYKKEKFDPKTLQTFDKVLVKTYPNTEWNCDLFSTMLINPNDYFFPYIGFNGMYKQCIPLNDETKHLIGTRDEAPEYYRYWE